MLAQRSSRRLVMPVLSLVPKDGPTTKCLNPKCGLSIQQPPSFPVGRRIHCDKTCERSHHRDIARAHRAMDEADLGDDDQTKNLKHHLAIGWGAGSKTFNF